MSDEIYDNDLREILGGIVTTSFEEMALKLFEYQYKNNPLYRKYVDLLSIQSVTSLEEIPCLPIEFFKSHKISTGDWEPQLVFQSSGTTGTIRSRHYVKSEDDYLLSCKSSFVQQFGPLSEYVFLALLPSYRERSDSSLICMMDYFIRSSGSPESGYFLDDYDALYKRYLSAIDSGRKVMIWGVSFALMEMAESGEYDLSRAIVVETGGMKGRREELTREELHLRLCSGFNVRQVCSEYGMTELFSQAYGKKDGIFTQSPFMRVIIREITDPFSVTLPGETGCINVIDLANRHSCCFIATQDLGKLHQNGSFEVSGRLDNADIRGCNLMIV